MRRGSVYGHSSKPAGLPRCMYNEPPQGLKTHVLSFSDVVTVVEYKPPFYFLLLIFFFSFLTQGLIHHSLAPSYVELRMALLILHTPLHVELGSKT